MGEMSMKCDGLCWIRHCFVSIVVGYHKIELIDRCDLSDSEGNIEERIIRLLLCSGVSVIADCFQ